MKKRLYNFKDIKWKSLVVKGTHYRDYWYNDEEKYISIEIYRNENHPYSLSNTGFSCIIYYFTDVYSFQESSLEVAKLKSIIKLSEIISEDIRLYEEKKDED